MSTELVIPSFTKGLHGEVHADALPEGAILSSTNMQLFRGDIGLAPGHREFIAGLAALSGTSVLGVDEYPLEAGTVFLLVMTTNKIYKWDGATSFTDISNAVAYTALLDTPWQGCTVVNPAGDLLFVVTDDSRDPVQKWNGAAATFTNLGGALADAGKHYSKSVQDFQNHLLHLNRTEGGVHLPRKLTWSDNGTPEVYAGGEAGFLTLFQGADWGQVLEPLNVYMTAYRERSIHLLTYVGPPFFIAQRQVVNGVGLLASRALLNMDNRHIFLGNDNVYIFNGVDLESVGDQIRDELFNRLDPAYAPRSLILFYENRNTMALIVPTANSGGIPDTWWFYNFTINAWSGPAEGRPITGGGPFQRRLSNTWASLVGNKWSDMTGQWNRTRLAVSFAQNLYGNTDMKLYIVDDSIVTANGVAVTGRVESGSYHPGRTLFPPSQRHPTIPRETTCVEIYPISDPQNLSLVNWFVGVADSVEGPFVWSGPYVVGVRGKVDVKPTTGKWFRFAFETTSPARVAGLVGVFERAG